MSVHVHVLLLGLPWMLAGIDLHICIFRYMYGHPLLNTTIGLLEQATRITDENGPLNHWPDSKKAKILGTKMNCLPALEQCLLEEATLYDAERADQETDQAIDEDTKSSNLSKRKQKQPPPPPTHKHEHLAKLAISEAAISVKGQFDLDPATGRRVNTLNQHAQKLKDIFSPQHTWPQLNHDNATGWLRRAGDPNYKKFLSTLLAEIQKERKSIVRSRVHQKRSKQIHQAKTNDVGNLLRPLQTNKSGTTYLHSAKTTPTPNGLTTTTPATTPTSRMEATKQMLTKQLNPPPGKPLGQTVPLDPLQ